MGAQPSAVRIAAACLAASAAAAAPTFFLGVLAIIAFPVGFIIAGGHMLLIGLPVYLLLRRRRPVDWGAALTAGFFIGVTPVTLLELYGLLTSPYAQFSPFISLIFGALGLLGGVVFRAVLGEPVDPRSDRDVAAVFD